MIPCPLCNQPMKNLDPDDYNGFGDAYLCEMCNVEQAVNWENGERIISSRD